MKLKMKTAMTTKTKTKTKTTTATKTKMAMTTKTTTATKKLNYLLHLHWGYWDLYQIYLIRARKSLTSIPMKNRRVRNCRTKISQGFFSPPLPFLKTVLYFSNCHSTNLQSQDQRKLSSAIISHVIST